MISIYRAFNTAGKIGIIAGLLGGAVGMIVFIIAAPLPGIIFSAIFILVFGLTFRYFLGPIAKRAALKEKGVQAEATILEVTDTGATVNEIYPIIKLRLQVRPPGGEPYEAETKELINRMDIPQFQPGAVIPVLYDPNNPAEVSVGTKDEAGAMSPDAQDPERVRMAEEFLMQEDKKNEDIRATGSPAKARILNAMPLGVFVNGNNPAMTFLVEVLPEEESPFQAQTVGVIQESSVPKYQPGREIYVKYDPADKSRVSLDHS